MWKPLKQGTDHKKHLLMCVVIGDEGRRVEKLDQEEVKNEIEDLLTKVFSDKIEKWNIEIPEGVDKSKIFRPIDIHVCKWDTDERFMGSYSFLNVGALANGEKDREAFNSAIPAVDGTKPTLYFAGEAFSERYSGYIQGAYQSGHDTAQQILDDLIPSSKM